jgi:hypothetical protein
MKYVLMAKKMLTLLVAFLLSQMGYSQANLVVSGAKINLSILYFFLQTTSLYRLAVLLR